MQTADFDKQPEANSELGEENQREEHGIQHCSRTMTGLGRIHGSTALKNYRRMLTKE
jgi:hypothetical protein